MPVIVDSHKHTRPRRLTWLALFAVLWSQVAVAGHQFEHGVHSLNDDCRVCAQLERHDDALAVPVPEPVVLPQSSVGEVSVPVTAALRRGTPYFCRAPPAP